MYIKLKDLRREQNLRQEDIAEILGTRQSVISRRELREFVDISASEYNALCSKLGKEVVDGFIAEPAEYEETATAITQGDPAMEIISKQADIIASILRKQTEQTDRLLGVLEKFCENENRQ